MEFIFPVTGPLSSRTKRNKKEKSSHIDAYSKKKDAKYPKYSKPRKMLPGQRRNKENYTVSAKSTFFLGCAERELPQRRRQDLLINASKCHKLSYKASKRSFIFFAERYFFVPLPHNHLQLTLLFQQTHCYSHLKPPPCIYKKLGCSIRCRHGRIWTSDMGVLIRFFFSLGIGTARHRRRSHSTQCQCDAKHDEVDSQQLSRRKVVKINVINVKNRS